jgi:hypothetical protein
MVGLVAFLLCLIAVIYMPPGPRPLHSVRISALWMAALGTFLTG